MVTSGVQHALDLVLRLLVPRRRRRCWSSRRPTRTRWPRSPPGGPGSPPTGSTPTDGWDADLLLGSAAADPAAAGVPDPRVPEPDRPPDAGRRCASGWSPRPTRAGTDLVVDESFVDLPLDGTPMPPPVAVFDRHARVLTIGGMSKPYWGGLRIGWVRASAPHGAAAGRGPGRRRHGQPGARPARRGAPARRGRRRSSPPAGAQLAAQRDALVAALREQLPDWRFTVPRGGVTLWAELDGPISSALARAAEEVGVRLAPGPRFGLDGTLERFLRLPFTLPRRRPGRGGAPDRRGPLRPGPAPRRRAVARRRPGDRLRPGRPAGASGRVRRPGHRAGRAGCVRRRSEPADPAAGAGGTAGAAGRGPTVRRPGPRRPWPPDGLPRQLLPSRSARCCAA